MIINFFRSTIVVAHQILYVTVDDKCDIHDEKRQTNLSVQFKPHTDKNPKGDDKDE